MTLPILLLALGAASAAGPAYSGVERNVRVEVPRIEATIEVDGHLTEAPWQQAARLTGFSQYAGVHVVSGRAVMGDLSLLSAASRDEA